MVIHPSYATHRLPWAKTPRLTLPAVFHASFCSEAIDGLTVCPNPTSSIITASFAMPEAGSATITVADIVGQATSLQVLKKELKAGINIEEINVANLPGGIYRIRIETNATVTTEFFLINSIT